MPNITTNHAITYTNTPSRMRKYYYGVLKEQYPVTAHAPNFDFWTGCREIKRSQESKRTLKNPFASRLGEFDTSLKLLSITEKWYFWCYFCRWPEDQKMGSAFMPIEGLFLLLASIQAQVIVKGIRRNETATTETVRKKPLRPWIWLRRSCGIKLREAECFATTRSFKWTSLRPTN